MEGDVGPVSRYTEIRGSDDGKGVGFSAATRKTSSPLVDFGMGADSIEIFPCFERRTRIYHGVSLAIKKARLDASVPCRVDSDPSLPKPHHNDARGNEA